MLLSSAAYESNIEVCELAPSPFKCLCCWNGLEGGDHGCCVARKEPCMCVQPSWKQICVCVCDDDQHTHLVPPPASS